MTGPDQSAIDRAFMAVALRLGARGLGTTAPNPSVGAVIVDPVTGEVLGRGWTQPGGRPHAEPEALRRAGPRARGATLYVTLEPCSHHGKTPPCADAIVAAGIGRVVCGIEDPDPRVAGRGLERLRAAGIGVTAGIMRRDAYRVTEGHILRVSQRRPFIQVKLATGLDGAVPRGAGAPTWVTGPQARARGHLLRARADAILIGHGTVRDDDPELTCRLPGLEHRSPVRVVLASDAGLPSSAKLLATAREIPLWVACAPDAPAEARERITAAGGRLIPLPVVEGRLWLPALCEDLVAHGITRLLVEGGPAVWRAVSDHGLVDEAVLFQASPASVVPETALARYIDTTHLDAVEARTLATDRMVVFRRHVAGPSQSRSP
jgi:diaminohydroxyphosphoribosylaminopyrimidine deaminase/5-amino-6-(5-phosphoribosylamino)uracil reductase